MQSRWCLFAAKSFFLARRRELNVNVCCVCVSVSHSFGYGLMDAAAMVKLARKWVTVPEQQRCEIIAKNAEK
jgi:hypothetical protein